MQRITPFLWFDNASEEAASFYVSVFRNAKIVRTTRYGEAGKEAHGRPSGSVMTIRFLLDGQEFIALNGGPDHKFNDAVSFVVNCETQEEIDRYWEKLSEGGKTIQCGWLEDRYGLSWQIVPTCLEALLGDADPEKSSRAMEAMLQMIKLDIATLKRAHGGHS